MANEYLVKFQDGTENRVQAKYINKAAYRNKINGKIVCEALPIISKDDIKRIVSELLSVEYEFDWQCAVAKNKDTCYRAVYGGDVADSYRISSVSDVDNIPANGIYYLHLDGCDGADCNSVDMMLDSEFIGKTSYSENYKNGF